MANQPFRLCLSCVCSALPLTNMPELDRGPLFVLLAVQQRSASSTTAEIFFLLFKMAPTQIRKWAKQLRRISWIKLLAAVTLTRVFVGAAARSLGVWIENRQHIEGECKSGILCPSERHIDKTSPEPLNRRACFLARVTPVPKRPSWLKPNHVRDVKLQIIPDGVKSC